MKDQERTRTGPHTTQKGGSYLTEYGYVLDVVIICDGLDETIAQAGLSDADLALVLLGASHTDHGHVQAACRLRLASHSKMMTGRQGTIGQSHTPLPPTRLSITDPPHPPAAACKQTN